MTETTTSAPGTVTSGVDRLDEMFAGTRDEGRAALVGYFPAGYPTVDESVDLMTAMVDGGCDLIEVGLPFSDPVLDGPVIQEAAQTALEHGYRVKDTFDIVRKITEAGGRAVVMTYFNPVLAYGPERFAAELAEAGGCGVITPDLIVDEAGPWLAAAEAAGIAPIFLVAPSSSPERIALTTARTRGFVYAASVMGVTGTRDQVSSAAPDLVARTRQQTDLPIGVGLGVRTGAQAAEIGKYADAVIVGSAFVQAARTAGDAADATEAVREVARGLAAGVASARSE